MGVVRIGGDGPGVVAVASLVRRCPRVAGVDAERRAAAARLVRATRLALVPDDRVHVALGTRAMVFPGRAAVRRPHQPAELDSREDDLGVVRTGSDPADMGRPRARRKAPGRSGRKVAESGELLPVTVAANPERARLAARIGSAVGRAVGGGEDIRGRQGSVAPGRAAVLALEQTTLSAAGQDALGVPPIDGDALRTRLLEHGLRPSVGDPHDGVACGDEKRRHLSATRPG